MKTEGMEQIMAKPWVGKRYEQGFRGKKIIALGDSHYVSRPEDYTENITIDVVNAFLNPEAEREGWMNTYTKFERAVAGRELSQEERVEFWNSILFCNYIQEPLEQPRQQATVGQYIASYPSFLNLLETYRPDGVIAWGTPLRNALRSNGQKGRTIHAEWEDIETITYVLGDGKKVNILPIQHPSIGFSWGNWHPVIDEFLTGL